MKKVSFVSENLTLDAVIFLPKKVKDKNAAILFVHGWTSRKDRSYQYAKALSEMGYICLLFDMRGHGESNGDINSFTIKEFLDDVLASYDYLLTVKGVDKDNISAVGSSFGGYLVALLTKKRNVKNLVLRVPADYPNEDFNNIKATSSHEDHLIAAWRKKTKKSSETYALDALNNFRGNVLIIESELDDVIPHETIENYKNAMVDKQNLTHIIMKGAQHSIKEGKFRDEVEKILKDWFRSRLYL